MSVTGTGTGLAAGGLVGTTDSFDSNINITAGYSNGTISGNEVGGLIGSTNNTIIIASYANSTVNGNSNTDEIGDIIGRFSTGTRTITESYGFGMVNNSGSGGTNINGRLPTGVTMPSQLSATNAGDSWDSEMNNTAGAWDFTRRVNDGPSLRFADYDGASGNAFHCEGQTAGADSSIEIPNCGEHLGGQFSE